MTKTYGSSPAGACASGRELRIQPGRVRRDRRPVRVGQVDAAASDGHARPPDAPGASGHRARRRGAVRPASWPRVRATPHRLRLPAVPPRRALDRARERRRRPALRRRRRAQRRRAGGRGARRVGLGDRLAAGRRSSPAASASASRSRGRSSGGRRSCSPTSRPATSTAPPARDPRAARRAQRGRRDDRRDHPRPRPRSALPAPGRGARRADRRRETGPADAP